MKREGLEDHFASLRQETRKKVFRAIEDLKQLGISDLLQAEIIGRLITGRRTVAELVEEIYCLRKNDKDFMSTYSRTRRSIRELESRGFVTTRLLGKDKPYRLTQYAITRLADFETPAGKAYLMPRRDILIHIATATLACLCLLVVLDYLSVEGWPLASIYSVFFVLVGISITRLSETIAKVTR